MAEVSFAAVPFTDVPCSTEHPQEIAAVVRHLCHEVRQPLSTIESAAFYLQMKLAGDARAGRELGRIQHMAHQIDWILSDATHFLQASPPQAEWVDLLECISSVLSVDLQFCTAPVEWAEADVPPLALVDPGQAQHLVRAVLNVFRQICEPAQQLRIALDRDGDAVVMSCSCPADRRLCELAEELLAPFTPHLPAGSGLALASVARIAQVNNGSARISGRDGVLKLEVSLPG